MKNNYIHIILIAIASLLLLFSCASKKSVVNSTKEKTDSVAIVMTDSLTNNSMVNDVTTISVTKKDSTDRVTSVIDSFVVETIVTRIVDVDGNVISTDKVTNRDHWRKENNDIYNASSKDVMAEHDVTTNTDATKVTSSEITNMSKDISDTKDVVIIEDSKSWWEKLTDKVSDVLAVIVIMALLLTASYFGYKYITGK